MSNNFFNFKDIKELTQVNLSVGDCKREDCIKLIVNKYVLLVSSKRTKDLLERDPKFKDFFCKANIIEYFYVSDYPELSKLEKDFKKFKNFSYDCIVAIGGGSAIDTAKIIKAFNLEKNSEGKFKELLNKKLNKSKNILPILIAIPTTAGTGSEVTPYATLWDFKKNKKYSISSNYLIPDYSFIDPELLKSIPIEVALNTGLDVINQAFDSIWNKNANKKTIILALKAIKIGTSILPKLLKEPFNSEDRRNMAITSLYAGICIAKTKTSVCHSISYPITSNFGVPHGLACVFTMNSVTNFIYQDKTDKAKEIKQK